MIYALLGFCVGGLVWALLQLLAHFVARSIEQAFMDRDRAMGEDVESRTGGVEGWTPRARTR